MGNGVCLANWHVSVQSNRIEYLNVICFTFRYTGTLNTEEITLAVAY